MVYRNRLEHLDRKMSTSTMHGIAPSSQRNLKTHINTYVRFCKYYNLDAFPADVLQERRYLQYLSEFHKCVDSSKNYVGGMRSLHELFGFTPPPSDDYLYQMTVSGIRRDKDHVVKQAAPITPEILVGISQLVNTNDGIEMAAWIGLLSGFYLLLRKSNLVPDSTNLFSGRHQLMRQNFVRMRDCYVARVYWSKTIQYHQRCLEIPMLPNIDWRLCPVYWLDRYFMAVPAEGTDPAFCVAKEGVNQSLTYPQLTYWLKEWVERLGYDRDAFSGHSACRGGAQWAAASGLPAHLVRLLGDWRSSAYERYLDMTLQERYDAMLVFNMHMN